MLWGTNSQLLFCGGGEHHSDSILELGKQFQKALKGLSAVELSDYVTLIGWNVSP